MKKTRLFFCLVAIFATMVSAKESIAGAITPNQCYVTETNDESDCPSVTNMAVSDIQGTSAMISWEYDFSDNSTFTLEYSVSGQNTWNTASTAITSTSYLLGGLEALTSYDVRVKATCSDEVSAWDTITFTTKCLAGGDIVIGNGTTISYYLPSYSLYKYSYSQQLFTSTEVGPATNISALAINMNTVVQQRQLDIYLMHTTATEITSWLPTSTAQLVYTGTQTLTTGWNTFQFTDTFAYDGTSNLVLIILDKTGSYRSGNLGVTHTAFNNCTRYAYRDTSEYSITTVPAASGTPLNLRNNVIFTGECWTTIPCVAPNMYVDNVGSTSADVIWAAGHEETQWELQYKTIDESDWTSFPNPGNGNITLNNLNPNTIYYVQMRSICNAQDSSEWVVREFRTTCGIEPIPFHENFNTYGTGTTVFPSCWTHYNTYNTSTDYPYITTINNMDSTGGSLYYLASSTTYDIAVTPELDANVSDLVVSFYLRVSETANGMIVGVVDNPNNFNTFVAVDTVFCAGTGTFEYQEVYMDGYTGTGKHVAFKNLIHQSSTSYTSRIMYFDDLVINMIPDCKRPSDLEVTAYYEDSLRLSWTELGQAQSWNIEYSTSDFEPGTNTGIALLASTNPYTVTGLEPATTYVFYIQADCENGVSEWYGPIIATTLCEMFTLPFVETFNNISSGIPMCWDNSEGTTTNESYKWNYYSLGMEGHCLQFNSWNNPRGNTNTLKTPLININAPATLKFYYKNPSGGDFSVYVLVANGSQTLLVSGLIDTAVWTAQSFDMTPYQNQQVQIAFIGTSNYGSGDAYLYLDSVSIKLGTTPGPQPEVCNAPTNVSVTNITKNSADIEWSQEGTPNSWTISYRKSSETYWTPVEVTSHPYTLANLEPQTAYNVKVTANCEETTSEESNVADFTTYPDGVNHYELDNTAIFPNPTTGQFTIQNVQCTIESVEIIDVYGKLLSNSEVNDHTFTININNYASGVYFVRIYTDMGMVTKQIVKK